jgi:hypothetical protein
MSQPFQKEGLSGFVQADIGPSVGKLGQSFSYRLLTIEHRIM